jgi:hypothetical protein
MALDRAPLGPHLPSSEPPTWRGVFLTTLTKQFHPIDLQHFGDFLVVGTWWERVP